MRAAAWGAGLILAAYPALAYAQQTAAAPSSANQAQADNDAPDDYADPADDIVVTGRRPVEPGKVIGDIPPELQLGPADIRAYGVDTIADLITELAPETQSGRGGSPAILLNGKRISNFHEIRDLPTEAILRVDILPEQVALEYGFSADQKVVNIVLRRHFRSTTLTLRDKAATEGGSSTPHGGVGIVNITPDGRFSLNVEYEQTSKLLESERNVTGQPQRGAFDLVGNITPAGDAAQIDPLLSAAAGEPVTVAGVPTSAAGGAPALGDFVATAGQANVSDLGRYRTLIPQSRDFSTNAVYARTIFGNVSATLNGRLEYTDSKDDVGLPGVTLDLPASNPFSPFSNAVTLSRYADLGNPLEQSSQSIATHLGTTFNGQIQKWNWSLTGNYDRTDSKTFTDTGVDASALQAALDAGNPAVNPFGPLGLPLLEPAAGTYARSISSSGTVDALITGSPFALPAGALSTSLHAGVETSDYTSHSRRGDDTTSGNVSRDIASGRLNVSVPIASRAKHFLQPLGDLSANVTVAADRLSDFGTLTSIDYGVNWSPIEAVRALVSWTDKDDAPSPEQLGGPAITTPNRRVFDYVAGQTVDISRISGGNPALAADTKHIFEAELNVKPLAKTDLSLIATYTAIRTDNLIATLPSPTAAIEAAFPDRFMRDASGTLIGVDARPVNFAGEDSKSFRWGFNLSVPLKSKIQKQFEAFRSGDGPNPLAGLRRHRRDSANGAPPAGGGDGTAGAPPSTATNGQPASASGSATTPGNDNGGSGQGFSGGGHHGGFGGGGRHGGFGGGGGRGQGGGRLQIAVYHTWRLEDQVNIRDGLPVLDLLHGETLGAGGGEPRHEVQAQLGYFNNGLGAQLAANWQSGTQVQGGTAGAPDTLDFSALTTLNLRLFADLDSQLGFVSKHPWARGMRITLSANNLFDSRQHVRDAAGETPISYQPDYLDPLGRSVMISVRKLFFQRSSR